jgi:hypothetical protein
MSAFCCARINLILTPMLNMWKTVYPFEIYMCAKFCALEVDPISVTISIHTRNHNVEKIACPRRV